MLSLNAFIKKFIIVALQCCVNLCQTAKWISCKHTYIPSFLDFLPIEVTTEHRVESPMLYSRFSLVIYFIHGIVYMSISISQFLPAPPCHICFLYLWLHFCFVNKFIFLDSTYRIIWYISFSDLVWYFLGPFMLL